MSPFDDHQSMSALEHTDELVVTGRSAPPTEAELSSFVAALRATAAEPAPRPSAALSALLRDGLAPPSLDPLAARVPRPARPGRSVGWRNRWRTVAGLGLAAKIVLGAGVAVASVGGAATIDAVPDAVQRPAQAVVSGVVGLFTSDPIGDPDQPAPAPARVVPAPTTAVPTESGVELPGSNGSNGSDGSNGSGNGSNGSSGTGTGLPAEGRAGSVQVPARPVLPVPSTGIPSGVGAHTPQDLPSAVPDTKGLLRSTTSGSSAAAPTSPPTPAPPADALDPGSAARKAAASATLAP